MRASPVTIIIIYSLQCTLVLRKRATSCPRTIRAGAPLPPWLRHPWPKQPCPKRFIRSITLSIVTNWRLKYSFEIEELMLVVPEFGNERWNIVRKLSEFFFGTKPIWETWTVEYRMDKPRGQGRSRFPNLKWQCLYGQRHRQFFENLGVRSPSNPIRTPYLKLSHNCDMNSVSGCPASVSSS